MLSIMIFLYKKYSLWAQPLFARFFWIQVRLSFTQMYVQFILNLSFIVESNILIVIIF